MSPRRQRAVGIDRCALVGTAVCHVEPDALAASRLDAKRQMRVDRCHDPRTLDDDAVVVVLGDTAIDMLVLVLVFSLSRLDHREHRFAQKRVLVVPGAG
ncbi:hypothetical protein G6F31_021031 [Rhizopus arrhizus]|nr:hypothetical protein G6F31_021031 [Rhizopus arrhizus]